MSLRSVENLLHISKILEKNGKTFVFQVVETLKNHLDIFRYRKNDDLLTEYFQRVCNFFGLQCPNLALIAPRVRCLQVRDLEVVAIHELNSLVRGDLGAARCEDSNATLPGQNVVFWKQRERERVD